MQDWRKKLQFEGCTVTSMGCTATLDPFFEADGPEDAIYLRFWVQTSELGQVFVGEFCSAGMLTVHEFTHLMASEMIREVIRFMAQELKNAGLDHLRETPRQETDHD